METSKIAIEHMRMEMRRDQMAQQEKSQTRTTVPQEDRQQHIHKGKQEAGGMSKVCVSVQSLQM